MIGVDDVMHAILDELRFGGPMPPLTLAHAIGCKVSIVNQAVQMLGARVERRDGGVLHLADVADETEASGPAGGVELDEAPGASQTEASEPAGDQRLGVLLSSSIETPPGPVPDQAPPTDASECSSSQTLPSEPAGGLPPLAGPFGPRVVCEALYQLGGCATRAAVRSLLHSHGWRVACLYEMDKFDFNGEALVTASHVYKGSTCTLTLTDVGRAVGARDELLRHRASLNLAARGRHARAVKASPPRTRASRLDLVRIDLCRERDLVCGLLDDAEARQRALEDELRELVRRRQGIQAALSALGGVP